MTVTENSSDCTELYARTLLRVGPPRTRYTGAFGALPRTSRHAISSAARKGADGGIVAYALAGRPTQVDSRALASALGSCGDSPHPTRPDRVVMEVRARPQRIAIQL